MFEIKTFSMVIFEKLPWADLLIDFTEFKLGFSLKTFFPPQMLWWRDCQRYLLYLYSD